MISWYIYNGTLSKAMVTLNLIAVKRTDKYMVCIGQARMTYNTLKYLVL